MLTNVLGLVALLAFAPSALSLTVSNDLLPNGYPAHSSAPPDWTPPTKLRSRYGHGYNQCPKEDPIVSILRKPYEFHKASAFCSTYIQSTSTKTETKHKTNRETKFRTTTAIFSTTKTDLIRTSTISVSTSTAPAVVCPPAPGDSPSHCGLLGYGNSQFWIGGQDYFVTDATACHELCLAQPDCLSFTTNGATACGLYSAPVSVALSDPEDGSPIAWYDSSCADYSPSECFPVGKRDIGLGIPARRNYTPKTKFSCVANYPASKISSACSCLIRSPSPQATVYTTETKTDTTTDKVTRTTSITRSATETDYVTETILTTTTVTAVPVNPEVPK